MFIPPPLRGSIPGPPWGGIPGKIGSPRKPRDTKNTPKLANTSKGRPGPSCEVPATPEGQRRPQEAPKTPTMPPQIKGLKFMVFLLKNGFWYFCWSKLKVKPPKIHQKCPQIKRLKFRVVLQKNGFWYFFSSKLGVKPPKSTKNAPKLRG